MRSNPHILHLRTQYYCPIEFKHLNNFVITLPLSVLTLPSSSPHQKTSAAFFIIFQDFEFFKPSVMFRDHCQLAKVQSPMPLKLLFFQAPSKCNYLITLKLQNQYSRTGATHFLWENSYLRAGLFPALLFKMKQKVSDTWSLDFHSSFNIKYWYWCWAWRLLLQSRVNDARCNTAEDRDRSDTTKHSRGVFWWHAVPKEMGASTQMSAQLLDLNIIVFPKHLQLRTDCDFHLLHIHTTGPWNIHGS